MKPELHRRMLRELAFVVVVGAPVLLFFLVAMPRANAGKLLKRLSGVEVHHTRFRQVEQLASQFSGYSACLSDNCVFQFQNRWLHRLGLAPLTEFTVMLSRSGLPSDPGGGGIGALDMAMLVVRDPPAGGAIASALVFDREGPPGAAFDASVIIDPDGHAGRTVVRLSPSASPRQRSRARAFNLRCLTSLGGCKNSRELLPGVWQEARRIQSVRRGASSGRSAWAMLAAMPRQPNF
ncbi:MAG: hypothetical protein ACRD1E_07080 [Terriglobales bacterium]